MIAPCPEYETPTVVARRLGITNDALWRLLDECGARLADRPLIVPVRRAEALYRQQLRCVFPSGFARSIDVSPSVVHKRLRDAAVPTDAARATRIPIGVLEEAHTFAPGPWCVAWRSAHVATQRPCAPWVLALALYDLAAAARASDDADRGGSAWCISALPSHVASFARALLDAPAYAPPARCGATRLLTRSRAA